MFKNRREGMVYLHWCALSFLAVALYLAWVEIALSYPVFFTGIDRKYTTIYLLGVIVASFWLRRVLNTVGQRLGDMDFLEASGHSRHQVLRFIAVLFPMAFIMKDSEASRLFLVGYVVLLTCILPFANTYIPRLISGVFFRDMLMRSVMAVNADEVADVGAMMAMQKHLGIKLVGWVGEGETPESDGDLPPKLGGLDELPRILHQFDVSQVVVSLHDVQQERVNSVTRCAESVGCRVRFFSHAQRFFPGQKVSIEHEGPFTFVSLTNEPLENPVNRLLKRLLDITVSLPIVAVVLPPLALLVKIMQWRQSPGPLIFKQCRSGHNQKRFQIFKFRTMHVAEDADVSVQARKDDARVFEFGSFLRRTSLDEFPQFLNVLNGDMSVSGPRPHLLEHDTQFSKIVNSYKIRHFVKPGITGLAQCRGFRGEILEPALLHKRIDSDMAYIRRWSISLDVQILLRTVYQMVFPPSSAY
jgi:exopolysaccharide biosynthesis polyprenyl glycosylphosphotransferase